MSRSFKKFPRFGNAANSDKPGKVHAHRVERATAKQLIHKCADWDDLMLPLQGQLKGCNPYEWPKDGKHYRSLKQAMQNDIEAYVSWNRYTWYHRRFHPTFYEDLWYRCMRK